MLGCAAYWEHKGLKVPALPLASCGISGRPLPFSVPLCSYLHKERVGSAAPRQLRVAMPLRFRCFRSRGERHGENLKQGRAWLDSEMNVSSDHGSTGANQIL